MSLDNSSKLIRLIAKAKTWSLMMFLSNIIKLSAKRDAQLALV
jgi:hypothetical protein